MEEKKKKSRAGMYVLIGLGVVAVAGTAVYFATRPKSNENILDTTTTNTEPTKTSSSSGSSSGGSSGFPLRKGSRGTLVKNVQEALIKKFGTGILPRFGADGHWGSEMQTALIAKNLPTQIDADAFKSIVTGSGLKTSGSGSSGGSSSGGTKTGTGKKKKKKFNPELLAKRLRFAVIDDDFSEATRLLSKIWTVRGYEKVSNEFKKKRIALHDGGSKVKATLVTGLLTRFSSKSEKKKLNAHFMRMGLKFDGSKWSLSGQGELMENQIKSLCSTNVWDSCGRKIKVPNNTILGEFLDAKNGVAKFKTLDDRILFTSTNTIGYV